MAKKREVDRVRERPERDTRNGDPEMERHFYKIEIGWDEGGFMAISEDEAQRKEEGDRNRVRVSGASRLGPRLERAGAETCQQSGEGVRPQVRASQPLRTPEAEGLG